MAELKRTPLYEIHQQQGASFVEFEGWEIPRGYGDSSAEYWAVKQKVGVMDASHRGCLKITGSERVSFLNGIVTNDVAKLPAGSGCYALMLNQKGRIVADMIVYTFQDHFLVDIEANLRAKAKESIERYIISEDAQVEDVSGNFGRISIQGPEARSLLLKLIGSELNSEADFSCQEFDAFGGSIACRVSRTGGNGYELLCELSSLPSLWEGAVTLAKERGGRPFGFEALNSLRVEAGIPWYGIDMDEDIIALEVPLEKKAISYTKGCYAGQEVVARVTYQGRVNKRLVGMTLESDRPANHKDKIKAEGRDIGFVTSSVISYSLKKALALGYVHRDFINPGSRVAVVTSTGDMQATVANLPFFKSN